MDQLICASLPHTHYWYEVGMLKVPINEKCFVFSSHSFWTSSSLDVPAGVTKEEGHTGFLIHLIPNINTVIVLIIMSIIVSSNHTGIGAWVYKQ